MWIDKRQCRILACERFFDEITGKQKKLSVTIKKDTPQERKKAAKLLAEKWSEMHQKTTDLRLSDVGKLYFADAVGRIKEQTLIRDKGQYRIVCNILDNALVDNLKASWIKAKLKQTGKPNVTLNSYIKIFKIVMRWAYRSEYTENIACVDRLQKFPDKSKRAKIQDKYLEKSELFALLDGMEVDYWQMMTRFLVLSGMRIGEVVALVDSDVDFVHKTININKTYSPTVKKAGTTKTFDSTRTIPIQKELLPLLFDIRKFSTETKIKTGARNDIFFCNPSNGKYIVYAVYEKYLRENSERILNRRVTAHVLRHTYTSIMAEDLPLDQIARQLGHSNSRITKEIYLHVTQGQKQKDADRIEDIAIFAH